MNGGDLTRSTFQAHRHYSGVRMQQGRVQLDADWNEQVDVTAHRNRAEAYDVIGADGVPKAEGGFELTVAPDGSDLLLSPGRAWVGGHLCEVDAETTAAEAASSTSVRVSSLVLDGAEIRPDEWVEVSGDDASVISRTSAVDVAANTLSLASSVSSLSGDLVLRRRASYAHQPDVPDPEHTTRVAATSPRVLDLATGTYLAYLEVWERAITAWDDPTISEPALGVDTATRSRVVWQVRLLDVSGVPGPVECDTDLAAQLADLAPATGLLAARAEPPTGSADLCRPTPAGGYVGLENQLYRVHVHDLDSGRPVVLWSRENASVVTTWVATVSSDVLQVTSIGRDAALGFKPGDWVELYDDTSVLDARPGTLVRLLNAKEDRLTLDLSTATGPTDIAGFPLNPQVRRWDSPGPLTPPEDVWVELENGVEVRFPATGTYRRHDYWLVPARSVTADVDWPRDSGGEPVPRLPAGVRRDIGRLAIVTRTDTELRVLDCRDRFPSLTTLTAADVAVGNDVCVLPGVETVQDAIDVLCRSNDLRRHNRLLHGYGIVCGLTVHCGDEGGDEGGGEGGGEGDPARGFSTADRRQIFKAGDLGDLEPALRERIEREGFDLDELRARLTRRFVSVAPGSAIDADGLDIDVDQTVLVDALSEAEALGGVIDDDGDGDFRLMLRTDPDQGPVVAGAPYVAPAKTSFLDGTLFRDIYDDCIAKLFTWIKAQLSTGNGAEQDQRAYLLRTALTNLLTYVGNPKSGGSVFVSENEHTQLVSFYEGLRKRLRSHTFCAMFDDARPYPDYPESLRGIRTVSGSGRHLRVRVHPGGEEAWTTGGGINPVEPATLINRYSLTEERLIERIDPVTGRQIGPGEKGSSAAAAVTDVAFSPDGKLVYATVPTRDGHDTLFFVGDLGATVTWRPATTICGVQLVTLATTEADPDHVYAVGLRRTATEGKAFSPREFTGAGVFRIPSREVPDGLGPIPGTEALNTIGHLVISPAGEAVFTCGPQGGTAEHYDRLVAMLVPGQLLSEMLLDGTGEDDLTIVLANDNTNETTAWTVVGASDGRQIVGFTLRRGAQLARAGVGGEGRLSLQAVSDRILVTDSNTSAARVFDASRHEFREGLLIPVQVAPISVAAVSRRAKQVVVLNWLSNSLSAIEAEIVLGDEYDLEPLIRYRREAVEAFADLVGGFAQYLKDCMCDHLSVKCPQPPEDKGLDLGVVSIRAGSVYRVCNFSGRRHVKSFPTVGYWLSLVPVLPALKEAIARACCAVLPETFAKYTTSGHNDADDRLDTLQVLRFLELAQGEDLATRLKNLDWDFLPSFLEGANSGDWGEPPVPPVEPGGPEGEAPPIEVRPGIDLDRPAPPAVRRPSPPMIVLKNLLRHPTIRRDLAQELASRRETDVEPQPSLPRPAEGAQLEALIARVEALEHELSTLKSPGKG